MVDEGEGVAPDAAARREEVEDKAVLFSGPPSPGDEDGGGGVEVGGGGGGGGEVQDDGEREGEDRAGAGVLEAAARSDDMQEEAAPGHGVEDNSSTPSVLSVDQDLQPVVVEEGGGQAHAPASDADMPAAAAESAVGEPAEAWLPSVVTWRPFDLKIVRRAAVLEEEEEEEQKEDQVSADAGAKAKMQSEDGEGEAARRRHGGAFQEVSSSPADAHDEQQLVGDADVANIPPPFSAMPSVVTWRLAGASHHAPATLGAAATSRGQGEVKDGGDRRGVDAQASRDSAHVDGVDGVDGVDEAEGGGQEQEDAAKRRGSPLPVGRARASGVTRLPSVVTWWSIRGDEEQGAGQEEEEEEEEEEEHAAAVSLVDDGVGRDAPFSEPRSRASEYLPSVTTWHCSPTRAARLPANLANFDCDADTPSSKTAASPRNQKLRREPYSSLPSVVSWHRPLYFGFSSNPSVVSWFSVARYPRPLSAPGIGIDHGMLSLPKRAGVCATDELGHQVSIAETYKAVLDKYDFGEDDGIERIPSHYSVKSLDNDVADAAAELALMGAISVLETVDDLVKKSAADGLPGLQEILCLEAVADDLVHEVGESAQLEEVHELGAGRCKEAWLQELAEEAAVDIVADVVHTRARSEQCVAEAEASVLRGRLEELEGKIKENRDREGGDPDEELERLQELVVLRSITKDTKLEHAKASRRGQDAKTALKQSWSLASGQETQALFRLQASARLLSVGRLVAFAARVRTERIAPGPAYYQHADADGDGKKEDAGWRHVLDWSVSDVSRWLDYFAQLPQYCAAFSDAGVDGPLLLELDDADLMEMGVEDEEHRRRVTSSVRALSLKAAGNTHVSAAPHRTHVTALPSVVTWRPPRIDPLPSFGPHPFHRPLTLQDLPSAVTWHPPPLHSLSPPAPTPRPEPFRGEDPPALPERGWHSKGRYTLAPWLLEQLAEVRKAAEKVRKLAGAELKMRAKNYCARQAMLRGIHGCAITIQSAWRLNRARKMLGGAEVARAVDAVMWEAADSIIYSVAQELGMKHREWIIMVASEQSKVLQAAARRSIGFSLQDARDRYAREDAAARVLQRTFGKNARHIKFLRSAVAELTFERAVLGESLDVATAYILRKESQFLLSACVRRQSVQRAHEGFQTTALRDVVTSMAYADALEEFWETFDEMYEEPKREAAVSWLRRFLVRRARNTRLGEMHVAAIELQAALRRRIGKWGGPRSLWLEKMGAMQSLRELFLRKKFREWHTYYTWMIIKFQRTCRKKAIIFAARRHKRNINLMVAVARANIYRRFYLHVLALGRHMTDKVDEECVPMRLIADEAITAAQPPTPPLTDEEFALAAQEEEERKGKKPVRRPKKKKAEAEEEKIRGPHLIDIAGCCEFFLVAALHFWEGGDAERALSEAPDDGSAPLLVAQAYAGAVNSSADEHLLISTDSGLLFDVKDWISPNGPGIPLITSSLQSFPLYAAVLVPIEAFLTHHARTDWIAHPGMPALESTRLLGALSALRSVLEKLGEDAVSRSLNGGHGAVLPPPGGAEDGELEAGEVTRGAGRAGSPGSPHGGSEAGEVEVLTGDEPLMPVEDGEDLDSRDLHEIMSECCARLLKSTSLQASMEGSDDTNAEQGGGATVLAFQALSGWLASSREQVKSAVANLSKSPPAMWAELWKGLQTHCYTSGHCIPILPLTSLDLAAFGRGFGDAWDAVPDGACERSFQAYDGSWSVVPITDSPDLFRIYVPPGYALNSTGLLIQTHDAPVPSSNRTSRHESILKCWHTWCANMHERMLPLVSRDHRVGFLGALSARKWRDRVRLWAEVAVEVAASKMLSCAIASAMVQERGSAQDTGVAAVDVLSTSRALAVIALPLGRVQLLQPAATIQVAIAVIVGRLPLPSDWLEIYYSSRAAYELQLMEDPSTPIVAEDDDPRIRVLKTVAASAAAERASPLPAPTEARIRGSKDASGSVLGAAGSPITQARRENQQQKGRESPLGVGKSALASPGADGETTPEAPPPPPVMPLRHPPEVRAAAAVSLMSLLSDPHACSIVTPQQALALASALEDELLEEAGSVATPPAGDAPLSPEIQVRTCVVNALDELLGNNPACSAVVIERLEWFGSRICGFLGVNAGKHAVCGSAAGIIASLSRDEEAAVKLVTEEPSLLHSISPLLQDSMAIQMRVRAVKALSALSRGRNLSLISSVPGLHSNFMSILTLQSLELLPAAADCVARYVSDFRLCALTMQHEGVFMSLLKTALSPETKLCTAAMRVIESLVLSIEAARTAAATKARPIKEAPGAKKKNSEFDESISTAEQIKQITSNSFALMTFCHMLESRVPEAAAMAANILRASCVSSTDAVQWFRKTDEALGIVVRCLGGDSKQAHRGQPGCRIRASCAWIIQLCSEDIEYADKLVGLGVFTKLKVLLYTDRSDEVLLGVVAALGTLMLGTETAVGPDDDLIVQFCSLLNSESDVIVMEAAKLLGRMIYQDYITLNVVLHEGKNLPQSDNWGLCDGFVRMEINGQSWESSVQRNTLRPVWEDEVQFIVSDKSEDLKITLFDWDMAGEELLGSLNISCEELEELGDELKHHLWAMTQADEANQVMAKTDAEVSAIVEEGQQEARAIQESTEAEAANVRDQLLEEARLISTDPKVESQRIISEANALADKTRAEGKASGERLLEYRADLEADRIKKAAKKRALEVTKIWKQMTAGIDDVPARADMLARQAASKYKRMVEDGQAEANKVLGKFKEKAGVLRKKAQDLQRTKVDAMEGWYVPVDEDGGPVMGVAGNVTGFDDKGKLVGDIETLPAGLRFTFKYDITANVDEVVFAEREWLVPRVAELLARENPTLTANLCCLLHGLCEDIEESRAFIGQHPGILKMLAQNLRPGGGGAYRANFEAFHLITLLSKDFANVMDVQNTQHMMGNIRQLKARWKDTEIADKVTNFLTKFDKTVARMRRQEDKERREQRAAQILEDKKRLKAAQEAKKQAALDRKLGNDPSRPRVKAARRPSTSRPSTSASRPGSTLEKGVANIPGTEVDKGGGNAEEAHTHDISGEAAGGATASLERLEVHVEAVPPPAESRGEGHADAVEGGAQAEEKEEATAAGSMEAGGEAAVVQEEEVVADAVGQRENVAGAADGGAGTGARVDGDVDAISGSVAAVPEQQTKDTDVADAHPSVVEHPQAVEKDELLSGTGDRAGKDEEGGRGTDGAPDILNLDEDVEQS